LAQIKQEQQKIKEDEAEHKKIGEIQRRVDEATAVAKKSAVQVKKDFGCKAYNIKDSLPTSFLQTILTEAARSTGEPIKVAQEMVDIPPMTVETLLKEATSTLKKATVTITGDVKEALIDSAPILNDKAEVLLVLIYYDNLSVFPFIILCISPIRSL